MLRTTRSQDPVSKLDEALGLVAQEVPPTAGYAEDYGFKPEGGGSSLHIKLGLIEGYARAGLETTDPRIKRNALQLVLDEVPAAIAIAERHGLSPDFGGSAVHIKLGMIAGYARDGLGLEA